MAQTSQSKVLLGLVALQLGCVITCVALNREYDVSLMISRDIDCLAWIAATYVVISGVVLVLSLFEADQIRQSWMLPALFAFGSAAYIILGISFSDSASDKKKLNDLHLLSDARYNAFMTYLVLSFVAGVAFGVDALFRILAKVRG